MKVRERKRKGRDYNPKQMNKIIQCVCLGAGRVAFSNQQSYIAAISARFVQLQHGDIDKRVNRNRNMILLT